LTPAEGSHDKGDGKGRHNHGPRPGSAAAEHLRPLTIALSLTVAYMVVEVIGGLISGSLALLPDAAHMAADVLGLGLALAAIQLSRRVKASQRTYGTHRVEVLAATGMSDHMLTCCHDHTRWRFFHPSRGVRASVGRRT